MSWLDEQEDYYTRRKQEEHPWKNILPQMQEGSRRISPSEGLYNQQPFYAETGWESVLPGVPELYGLREVSPATLMDPAYTAATWALGNAAGEMVIPTTFKTIQKVLPYVKHNKLWSTVAGLGDDLANAAYQTLKSDKGAIYVKPHGKFVPEDVQRYAKTYSDLLEQKYPPMGEANKKTVVMFKPHLEGARDVRGASARPNEPGLEDKIALFRSSYALPPAEKKAVLNLWKGLYGGPGQPTRTEVLNAAREATLEKVLYEEMLHQTQGLQSLKDLTLAKWNQAPEEIKNQFRRYVLQIPGNSVASPKNIELAAADEYLASLARYTGPRLSATGDKLIEGIHTPTKEGDKETIRHLKQYMEGNLKDIPSAELPADPQTLPYYRKLTERKMVESDIRKLNDKLEVIKNQLSGKVEKPAGITKEQLLAKQEQWLEEKLELQIKLMEEFVW